MGTFVPMKSSFSLKLCLFSALLLAIIFVMNRYFLPPSLVSSHSIWLIVYFFVTTLWVNRYLTKANQKSPQHFVRAFMGLTAARMGISLFVILAYGLINRDGLLSFAIQFLILYFLFLIMEIISIQKMNKKEK